MPDSGYDNDNVNRVLEGSKNPVGINRTGLLFGNPISSYDINSMQNNLLGLIAGYSYAYNNLESSASIDLVGWGLPERLTNIHNIRAAIRVADRGETYIIYCPRVTVNLPSTNRDQYLKIYYRVVAYVSNIMDTHYEQPDNSLPLVDTFTKYGYVQSASTETLPISIENDIADNEIDSEVSIRLGIQWTLSWEYDNKLPGFTEGPAVALYRYKNSSNRFLFNTTRQLAYNSNLLSVPTICAKTVGDYIVLDGIYDMMMSSQDSSVFKAMVVFDQTFNIGATKHIVIGVKDAPDVDLEYRLVDGTIVTSGSDWYVRWLANKPYLMHCAEGIMSYTDPSLEQWRYISCYALGTHVSSSGINGTTIATSTINKSSTVLYIYDITASKWHPKVNMVYTFGSDPTTGLGIEHVYNRGAWKTTIPAGTLVSVPVYYDKNGANLDNRVFIPGTVLCNGASLSKTVYSALYEVLGARFGETSTTFKVPNYSGVYPKSLTTNITSPYTNTTDSKITLQSVNIPTMQVRNAATPNTPNTISVTVDEKEISAPAYSTKVWFKSKPTISLSQKSLDSLMISMLKHYHLPGNLAYNNPTGTVDSNPFMYNQTDTVSHSSSSSSRIIFPSTIDPGNTKIVDSNKKVNYAGIPTTGPINTGKGNQGTAVVAGATGKKGPNISWGLTSLGIQSKSISAKMDADLEITASETGSSQYFGAKTTTSNNLNHKHTASLSLSNLKVGTTGSSPTPIAIEPSYYKVNTYIYLGQSLVVPETPVTITTESTGNAYTAPSISAELYASSTGNMH